MNDNSKLILKKDTFKKCLSDKGMTILELAYKMNVDPSTIYRMVNGRDISGKTIVKLIRALGYSEKDFDKLFIFSQPLPKGNKASTA